MNLKNIKILSLSGGGIKGFIHMGALKYLEDKKVLDQIEIFAGTSIGAILCAFLVLGYNVDEIFQFCINLDLNKILNISFENLMLSYGLDTGLRLDHIVRKLIIQKNYNENITLKELYDITNKKLITVTTCITTKNPIYMSHENYPDITLRLALRMSSCMPIIMTPIKYQNKYYIDGACLEHIPIDIFKNDLNKLIAINIIYDNNVSDINSIESYMYEIFKCIMNNTSKYMLYQDHIINIINDEVLLVDLDITNETKYRIFNTGYNSIKNIIENQSTEFIRSGAIS